MSNQVPPGPGQPPYQGAEPPYGPYSSQAPGVPPVPPPPGSYPTGGPDVPSYGQPPSYGSEPSYGPAQQPYGPAQPPYGQPSGQEQPPYGQPSGQEQPPYGQPGQGQPSYDPAQPGYGAVPGYQPGQGQYPPQGGYVPSYGGGPGAPKSGSGGKVVAIVAAAVVVVGLVIGGVVLLTRNNDNSAAGSTTSSSARSSTTSAKPKPDPTTSGPKRTATPPKLDVDEAQVLAETAFPAAAGYSYDFCHEGYEEFDSTTAINCFNDVDDFFDVYVWNDSATALSSIRADYKKYDESSWDGGTEFRHDGNGIYYQVVRCYADAPVCIDIFEDTKDEAEAVLGRFSYLDAAGIAALNDKLAGGGI